MEKIISIFRWVFQNFFFILLIIFVPIYLGWSWLVPFGEESISRGNFFIGLTFLSILWGFAVLMKKIKSYLFLKAIFLILASLFGYLNYWHVVNYFPDIEEVATFNGTIYILADNQLFLENPFYDDNQLTKIRWGAFPATAVLPGSNSHVGIVYDKKMKLVSVVERAWDDSESLLYTDSIPPREFAFWVWPTEFEGKKYYLTYVCNPNPENKYDCIATYTLYQCKLDNTSCVPLPFQYTEKDHQVQEIVMERDNTTNNVNVSFYWDGIATLIFSYGDHPRCYAEGCEILTSP